MKILAFLLTFCLMSVIVSADELTWNTLASRPDLWPVQCTMKVPIAFQGGINVAVGQKVNVVRFTTTEVEVNTLDNQTTFTAAPDEIDCLDAAAKQYASFTPKQKGLTYASLMQQKDLWPAMLTITRGFAIGGQRLENGDRLKLMNVQNGSLYVISPKINARFSIVPSATDIMAQAREFVENDQAGPRLVVEEKIAAENRLVTELQGRLVNSVTDQQQPLDANAIPKYFVFIRGSSTCPITHNFLPSLISFYNQMKPKHPEFEIVYIMDETNSDTSKFAQQQGFSWRALTFDNTPTTPNNVIDGRLPQLFVMDRSGKLLINGIQYDAPKALAQLQDLLSKT